MIRLNVRSARHTVLYKITRISIIIHYHKQPYQFILITDQTEHQRPVTWVRTLNVSHVGKNWVTELAWTHLVSSMQLMEVKQMAEMLHLPQTNCLAWSWASVRMGRTICRTESEISLWPKKRWTPLTIPEFKIITFFSNPYWTSP